MRSRVVRSDMFFNPAFSAVPVHAGSGRKARRRAVRVATVPTPPVGLPPAPPAPPVTPLAITCLKGDDLICDDHGKNCLCLQCSVDHQGTPQCIAYEPLETEEPGGSTACPPGWTLVQTPEGPQCVPTLAHNPGRALAFSPGRPSSGPVENCPGQITCADGRCVNTVADCDLNIMARPGMTYGAGAATRMHAGSGRKARRRARRAPSGLTAPGAPVVPTGSLGGCIETMKKQCGTYSHPTTAAYKKCVMTGVRGCIRTEGPFQPDAPAQPGGQVVAPPRPQTTAPGMRATRRRLRNMAHERSGYSPGGIPSTVNVQNYPQVWPRGLSAEEAAQCTAWHWSGWSPTCMSMSPGLHGTSGLQRTGQQNPVHANRPPLPRRIRRQPKGISLR